VKVLAALFVGLLIGYVLVAGLIMFKNAAWAKAEQWSQQSPPPQLTFAQRIFLRTGNFVASYWLLSSSFIVLASVGVAVLVATLRTMHPK
jgi:hypothetical protein